MAARITTLLQVPAVWDQVQDILLRQWNDLLSRPSGPMSFRFLLQPTMAVIFAIRDGMKDARAGNPPYFWAILHDHAHLKMRIEQGFKATLRVMIFAVAMDLIYQVIEFKFFYPVEALIVALALAFVPYLIMRGPVRRIAYWWLHRHDKDPPDPIAPSIK